MACRTEGPSPTAVESDAVCNHLNYIISVRGLEVPECIKEAIKGNGGYGGHRMSHLDHDTDWLCSICRKLTEAELDTYVYAGRNPKARALATWWDRHQEVDRRREADETRHAARAEAYERVKAMLTPAEFELLRIPEPRSGS